MQLRFCCLFLVDGNPVKGYLEPAIKSDTLPNLCHLERIFKLNSSLSSTSSLPAPWESLSKEQILNGNVVIHLKIVDADNEKHELFPRWFFSADNFKTNYNKHDFEINLSALHIGLMILVIAEIAIELCVRKLTNR